MTSRNSPADPGAHCASSGSGCVSCGATLRGPYCAACGERAITADDSRFVVFLRDMLSGAFDLDSRLWRSLRAVVLRPGLLTAEYVRGRRRPYISPLQVFLLANLVFFAAFNTVGGTNAFTTELHYHIRQPVYGPVAERMIAKHGEHNTPGHEEYTRRFDEATPRFASSMIILMVPLLALALWLLYGGRRPYLHHVVMALHLFAVMLLALTVLPLVATAVYRITPVVVPVINVDLVLVALITVGLTYYFAAALRRAYGDRFPVAVARGFALGLLMFPVLTVYRTILFFTVYWSLD